MSKQYLTLFYYKYSVAYAFLINSCSMKQWLHSTMRGSSPYDMVGQSILPLWFH